jgi:hypothetical protein
MPPTDPRFLAMTDDDIVVEYEALLAARGEKLKECPCGMLTHDRVCPFCSCPITGDPVADDLRRRAEAGEDVDLNLLDPRNRDTFEPIDPGELP